MVLFYAKAITIFVIDYYYYLSKTITRFHRQRVSASACSRYWSHQSQRCHKAALQSPEIKMESRVLVLFFLRCGEKNLKSLGHCSNDKLLLSSDGSAVVAEIPEKRK